MKQFVLTLALIDITEEPINREDMGLDIIMRLYAPDLEKYKSWSPPTAKKL